MFRPSRRKVVPLNLHQLQQFNGFGGVTVAEYNVRYGTLAHRRPQMTRYTVSPIRALHGSNSQFSVKELTPKLKPPDGTELIATPMPAHSPRQPISLIQVLYGLEWSSLFRGYRQRLTLENVVHFTRKLPSSMATGYWMVRNSREYELAERTVVSAWRWSVWIARGAYLWLCMFVESREYYYLRYYTLLGLEWAIGSLRMALRFSLETLRNVLAKK